MFPGLPTVAVMTVIALAALSGTAEGQQAELPARLRERLDHLEALGFSGAAGVQRGGEVLLEHAVGFAELDPPRRFTVDTGFFIASLSKSFTAALVLALHERGRLSVGHRIGKHVSGVPDAMAGVTLHQLLSHTSGLLRLDGENFTTGTDVLAGALRAGLEFEPGSRFDYSNAGYAVLTAIAERAGGKSYEELARDLLFEPAGMHSTSVVTERAFWKRRPLAVGHSGLLAQGDALLRRPYGRDLVGPAGIVTTIGDMLRWELALRAGKVLSEASREAMFTPVLDVYAYGFGVWPTHRGGGLVAAHDGHIQPEGFNAYYVRLLERDAAVIVFANRGDVALAERVAWNLVDILLGNNPQLELPALGRSRVKARAGRFQSRDGARLAVRRIGGRAFLEPLDQATASLFLEDTEDLAATTHALQEMLHEPEKAPPALRATLAAAEAQAERFGPLRTHEVLYSVHEIGFVRTHLRHVFERGVVYTRVDTVDGEVVGGTDAGAFISGGQGLTPTLAGLCLAPVGERAFVAYDFWAGRAVPVHLDRNALVVGPADAAVRFEPGTGGR